MSHSRPRPTVLLAALAVLALLMTAVTPVFAAPASTSEGGSRLALAQPEECDEISLAPDGGINVGNVLVTAEQLALLDADVFAALMLAAAVADAGPDIESCVDVEIGEGGITVVADITFCPVGVDVDAEGNVSINGIAIDAALLSAELVNLLEAISAAGVQACVGVFVAENEVQVEAAVEACVTATANEDGSVMVVLAGFEILFPAGSIDDAGVLEGAVDLEVGLNITASLGLEADDLVLEATVVELDGCGAGGPALGDVLVVKYVDEDGDLETAEDQFPAADWSFSFSIRGGDIVDESTTTDDEGTAGFAFTTESGTATVSINEHLEIGYELLEASCYLILDEAEDEFEEIDFWTDLPVTFDVEEGEPYFCVFINGAVDGGTAPTTAPTAAPTGGQGPATDRPTVTLPPTDAPVSGTAAVPGSWALVIVTLGLVASGALLLTTWRPRRTR